jgi:hypothetical protein
MALEWVSTGVDEDGNETGYNIDNSNGRVWDADGNLLDQTTAQPVDPSYYTSKEFYRDYPEATNVGSDVLSTIGDYAKKFGQGALDALKNAFTKTVNGKSVVDWRSIAGAAGGVYGLYRSQQAPEKTGYQGGIPKYEAVRETVANTYDPNRRPGSAAQDYFSSTKFVAPKDAAAARTAAKQEAVGLEALNKSNPARQERTVLQAGAEKKKVAPSEIRPASSVIKNLPVPKYASGGIAEIARGRYLAGATDGMADKIPARIGGKQEARLSHGEFVIPADVVGHLGNGNSEAGAQRLYAMMDKIRKARTGTTKQGKQINPDEFLA